MSQEIVIRGQIDAANSERALKFDLKNSFSISIAEEAMLQRFLNKWRDYVTPGQWTPEDLSDPFTSYYNALDELRFSKDDPSTPYDETTRDGIKDRLFARGVKVFGQEFADEVFNLPWNPADFQRLFDEFLTPASDFIKKRVLTYMAYQNAMDADIRVLDGQIEGLIQEQKKAAESWAENEAADA